MKSFFEILFEHIPSSERLLELEPKYLAGYFLLSLDGRPSIRLANMLTAEALINDIPSDSSDQYPEKYHNDILFALMEAWQWLLSACLVAPEPTRLLRKQNLSSNSTYFITRLGQSIKTYEDYKDFLFRQ